jgi:hypothetical protein
MNDALHSLAYAVVLLIAVMAVTVLGAQLIAFVLWKAS